MAPQVPRRVTQQVLAQSAFEPQIAYDGVYMHYENADYISSGLLGMSARIPSGHLPTGWQMGTFDLDQDWNWLVRESANNAANIHANNSRFFY